MALNYVHSDFRHVPADSLRRHPSELHLKVYARLRSMLRACSDKGILPLSSGRRGPIARLRELHSHLQSLSLSTFAYPRGGMPCGFVEHSDEGPEALRPYRDVDPERLRISG